jgi:hypothetical protein
MGSLLVVFLQPGFRGFACFTKRLEEPAVQAAVAEHGVEALDVTALPGAAGLDEARSDVARFDPVLDLLGHELGAVVVVEIGADHDHVARDGYVEPESVTAARSLAWSF